MIFNSVSLSLLLAIICLFPQIQAAKLVKRGPLGVQQIISHLSNVDGRDFCFEYVSATADTIPTYVFSIETYITVRSFISRTTESSVVTTTTSKGIFTTTSTRYSTVTERTTVSSVTKPSPDVTITVTLTDPSASTYTYTEISYPTSDPAATYEPLRKRQLQVPEILKDSNPTSISVACTRLLSRFPVYTTSIAGTTTQTVSYTSSVSTTISSTKTSTAIVTVPTEYRITTTTINKTKSERYTERFYTGPPGTTETSTYYVDTITTTVTYGVCDSQAIPTAVPLWDWYPASTSTDDEISTIVTENSSLGSCCEQCWTLEFRGGACIGYTFTHEAEASGTCTLLYRSTAQACATRTFLWDLGFPEARSPRVGFRRGFCYWYGYQCSPAADLTAATCQQEFANNG